MAKIIRSSALALAAIAILAGPALAKAPPTGIWMQYHFKDARGHVHTVTEQEQIVRASYAEKECTPSSKMPPYFLGFLTQRHPELAHMTFVSSGCEMDKNGHIRIAVGAWPTGGK